MPEAETLALLRRKFCCEEMNPPGPVQSKLALLIVVAFNCNALPAQTGLLERSTGAGGNAFTKTDVVTGALVQPLTVTVIE